MEIVISKVESGSHQSNAHEQHPSCSAIVDTCTLFHSFFIQNDLDKSSNQLQVTQLSVESEKRVNYSDNTVSRECPPLALTTILYQILLSP